MVESSIKKVKILNPIVIFDAILVMNDLVILQEPPEMFAHDQAMFRN